MKKNFFNKYLWLISGLILLGCNNQNEQDIPSDHISHIDVQNPELIKTAASPTETIFSELNLVKAEKMPVITELTVQGKINYDERSRKYIAARVSGRIEKLTINYNFQEVRKGQLIMEIYSPELVTAQREYLLLIKQNDQNNIERAKQKLLISGFQENLIKQIENKNEPLYSIPVYAPYNGYISQTGNFNETQTGITPSPVLLKSGQYVEKGENLFNVYDYAQKTIELSIPSAYSTYFKKGKTFLYKTLSAGGKWNFGKADVILPVQKETGNFLITRSYLKDENLKYGDLIQAVVSIVIPESLWIPKQAVYFSGNRSIVFKWEKNAFKPVAIQTGLEANGFTQVLSPIENWEIASNGSFLVDSESFIKTNDYEEY